MKKIIVICLLVISGFLASWERPLDAADIFCPNLEGINLKCYGGSEPKPPPSGKVCDVETKKTVCHYYSGAQTVTRSSNTSVCTAYSCRVENTSEGLPRYISQCESRTNCCSTYETSCYSEHATGEGTATVQEDCSVTVDCPGMPGMVSGGPNEGCSSMGGDSGCSGGGSCPSEGGGDGGCG